jgi:hypothetical protein
LHDLTDQLRALGEQAGDEPLEIVNGEHDPTDAERVYGQRLGADSDRVRRVEFIKLDPAQC